MHIMKNIMIPQNKIFNPLFLLTFVLFVSLESTVPGRNTICPDRERQALLEFKNELFDEYNRLSSWGTGENKMECCNWIGVICNNRTNHVERLNLRGPAEGDIYHSHAVVAPLKGSISPSLLELNHLIYLDLSNNDFIRSDFPEFICSLGQLQYLDLSNANLGGLIPQRVGNLSKLLYLNVRGNLGLHSKNLDWISHLPSLEYLDLSYVDLYKATNWLQAITQLRSTRELHLSACTLYIIPSSLPSINATSPLAVLDLSRNILPHSFIYWLSYYNRSLEWLDFSYNIDFGDPNSLGLSNMIRQTHRHPFGNGSSLIYLNLQLTRSLIGGQQLSQLIMDLFGPLESKLRYLDLSFNQLNGSLPDMSRFSFLTQLHLNNNNLSGFLSKGHLTLPNLQVLDLSSNQIMGQVPDLSDSNAHLHPFPDMSRFSFLTMLNLDNNYLSGFALKGVTFPYLRVLVLSRNQITGHVPDFSFCSSLEQLYLSHNMFNGTLPESIGRLSKLEVLSIPSNRLEGVITEAHMFNLSSLRVLDLSFNSFLRIKFNHSWTPPFQLQQIKLNQCKIGPSFPQWLTTQYDVGYLDISDSDIRDTVPSWFVWALDTGVLLDVSRNKISGPLAFLCHLTSWSFINLSENMLSGKLPECFASFEKLEFLNLANNNLSGTIPYSFGSLHALRWLGLRNNSVSGRIPRSLSNCSNLQILDLGENRLIGNIPAWIGRSFRKIVVLRLCSNEFIGSIPSSLCGLAKLQILDLSSNNVSGAIPKCICNLSAMTIEFHQVNESLIGLVKGFRALSVIQLDASSIMAMYENLLSVNLMWKGNEVKYTNSEGLAINFMDLSNNTISGEIPDEMTKLVGLHALNLSRNNLFGHIPDNIALLKSLESLDLSWNHISDSIPTGLSELDSLGFLNLSYNNLSGKIPPHLLKFDKSSYIGNSLLCGRPILSTSCPGDDQTDGEYSSFNNAGSAMNHVRQHKENEFITTGFYIGIALGFVTGFWGIIGTIIAKKSFRYAVFKITSDVGDCIYLFVVLRKNRLLRYFTK
ncbi:receptor-like protein EIX2 [Henckelia pumila]|uniref:receptor-like protein EIX2 n=1 Tax=Henckelia pumila TaxID=405737 RepID=UPI003C6E6E36